MACSVATMRETAVGGHKEENNYTILPFKKEARKETSSFLSKVYSIVEGGPKDLVSWSNDGLYFVVKQPSRFASEILPAHFRTNNFNSFVRQLNFYGFRKLLVDDEKVPSMGDGENVKRWKFHHPNFLRGRSDLLKNIKRKTYSDANTIASREELENLKLELEEKERLKISSNNRMQELEEHCARLRNEIETMKLKYSLIQRPSSSQSLPLNSLDEENIDWSSSKEDFDFILDFDFYDSPSFPVQTPQSLDYLDKALEKFETEERKSAMLELTEKFAISMFPFIKVDTINYPTLSIERVKRLLNQLSPSLQSSLVTTVIASLDSK